MKKILFIIFISTSIFAQQKEVVYENIFLSPLKSNENLLVEGVKKHNQKFHSKGESIASLYSVLVGKHSGQYVWLNGPMKMSDYDNMPNSSHMEDWQKNIRNNVTNETVKMAKLNCLRV